ncbi:MAG TPA: thioredoxin domain-containing protein, partial [Pyrinomonadaceae bacterium]|nr:thioredoxin domain-containing protein [Pyrinomonadaceae bacterium]
MKDERELIRLARPVAESDHVVGPQSAPATLVEYGDYECPYCRRLHPMVKEIMSRLEGLRFVFRHFPLRNVHPHAVRAAEAAEAASAQGRFWQMHDALFAQDQPLDDERLARVARTAGLDVARYASEMSAGVYGGKVEEDFKAALYADGVTGTPTFYLNGVRLSNIGSLEALLQTVMEAGA